MKLLQFARSRPFVLTARIVVGLAFLILVLQSVFRVPIIADDLYIFADWARQRLDFSWWTRLDLGQTTGTDRVLPVGRGLTPIWLDGMFGVGDLLHVSADAMWRAWRIVGITSGVVAAAAFATVWKLGHVGRRASGATRPSVRAPWLDDFTSWFLVLALVVGSFAQIHSLWGGDPITAYIYPSWGTCVLIFAYLALLRPALSQRDGLRSGYLAAGAVVGCLGVWFYELFIPAVVLGACAVSLLIIRNGLLRRTADAMRGGVAFLALVVVPAIAFLIPRTFGGSKVYGDAWYPGTQPDPTLGTLKAFWGAFVTSLPGSSWPRTDEAVGSFVGSQFVSVQLIVGIALLLAASAYLLRWTGGASDSRVVNASGRSWWRANGLIPRWWLGVLLALGASVGTILLQSVTARYQAELGGIVGNVYTFYATSSIGLAVIVALVILVLVRTLTPWVPAVALVLLGLAATQQVAANVRLQAVVANEWVPANRVMVTAFSTPPDESTDGERCAALRKWAQFPHPAYYRDNIGSNLARAYLLQYGVPFCAADPTPFAASKQVTGSG